MVDAVFLVGRERHPVEAIVGEERIPFLVALGVEQSRLLDDEVDEGLMGDRSHRVVPHIVIVMYLAQARYWLRIGISLVPTVVTSFWPISAGSKLRCRLTHSLPLARSPDWMPR